MKCPIRVASADGTCQNAETDPNGTLFACADRVHPNGTRYRYGRTNKSPPTFRNISGIENRSKYVFAC